MGSIKVACAQNPYKRTNLLGLDCHESKRSLSFAPCHKLGGQHRQLSGVNLCCVSNCYTFAAACQLLNLLSSVNYSFFVPTW